MAPFPTYSLPIDPQGRLAVGLCTYKRPQGLARVLDHLGLAITAFGRQAAIIVVDNDGKDPEVGEITRRFSASTGIDVHYEIEPHPGISAARNAVFARAEALGVRWVAMLDDDEWPTPPWLTALFAAQGQTGAAVVGGPVTPVFPDDQKHLTKVSRYWSVGPQLLEGRPFVFCTCNFLIDLDAARDVPRPFFDEAFGLSGGGDTVFFRGLFYRGLQMAWAEDAVVHEEVPPSRASLAWMRTRRFRVGNHAVQWEVRDKGGARALAKSFGLMARLPIYPLFGREPESRMVGWLLEYEKVRGRIAAHLGAGVVEYARPGQSTVKACR